MRNELKINQVSKETAEWYQEYLKAIDSSNAERCGEFFTEDCEFQFGNQPKVKGKKVILEGFEKFWKMYDGEEHVLQNIVGRDDCFASEALNIFTRKDGKKVTCPALAITERNEEGLMTLFRVFIDVSPIFA